MKVRCGKLSSNDLHLKGKLTAKYWVCFLNNVHHWLEKKKKKRWILLYLARTGSVQCINLFISICGLSLFMMYVPHQAHMMLYKKLSFH